MNSWNTATISDAIITSITKYTGVTVDNPDRHLLCADFGIIPVDFLYVFQDLEGILHFPVSKVLAKRDYTVFTISNLAAAISEDLDKYNSEHH